jgi:hypothetical protein
VKRSTATTAVLLLAACGFTFGSVQAARAQGEPAAAAEHELQKLRKVLDLSAAQESKLVPILQAEIPKMEAIKTNPSLSGPEKAKQAQAVHSQADPQVKAILNPSQYKLWESIRQNEINEIKQEKK